LKNIVDRKKGKEEEKFEVYDSYQNTLHILYTL